MGIGEGKERTYLLELEEDQEEQVLAVRSSIKRMFGGGGSGLRGTEVEEVPGPVTRPQPTWNR